MTAPMVVAVEELRRAYRAVQEGQFRARPRPSRATHAASWVPATGERVVLVCGGHGSAGTSTIALALATAAGRARVVECCSPSASGLASAAHTELGEVSDGWLRGVRDAVVLERRRDPAVAVDALPVPTDTDLPFTIVDPSFGVETLLAGGSWLGELARTLDQVVLVSRATVPGIRQLETALGLLGPERVFAVLVGATERRWPRPVEQAAGRTVRQLRATGRMVAVPLDPSLALTGPTRDPLPKAVLAGAARLLTLLEGELS